MKTIIFFMLFTLSLTKSWAMDFKIMTHNLAMKTDASLFKQMSTHLDSMNLSADLIFLQEVVGPTGAIFEKEFKMASHFVKRPWDQEAVGVLTKHPIYHRGSLTLNSRAQNGFTRTAAMIEFRHPTMGLIRAVGVHFAYRPEQSDIRFDQLKEVTQWIEQRNTDIPADYNIVGGDFNAVSNESLFSHLKHYNNPNSNIITHFPTQRRIDYIFIKGLKSKTMKIQEFFPFPNGQVEGKELSDHKTIFMIFNQGK